MEMVNKIQEILNTSKGQLESTILNVEQQFQEHANHIRQDIANSEKQLEAEIKKFVEENQSKAEQIVICAKDRQKAAAKLREGTDKDLKAAEQKFRSKITDVGKSMDKSFDKLEKFANESHTVINRIIEQTKGNPIEMGIKLTEQVEPMQKKFTGIREDISKNLKTSFEKSQTILKELEKSVNDIETKTRKQYEDIFEKFKKCSGKLTEIVKLLVGCLFPETIRRIEWS